MKRYIILYLAFCTTALDASPCATEQPTALPFGRLLLMLHETNSLDSENPAKKEVGPVTLRAGTALAQEAGILILSPAIWQNLLFRKHWFACELTKPGSLASLLCKHWRAYQENPSPQILIQINALLKSDPTLMYHFYLWQQDLSPERWCCFYHPDASLVILIPAAYLEEHAGLLPRPSIATGDHHTVMAHILTEATGLHLTRCRPIVLSQTIEGLEGLFGQAKHLQKRSSFSLAHLQSLFVTKKETHPLMRRHWNMYMTGHSTPQESICGLARTQFIQFLSWCNTHLYLHCFYYQSCYNGGQNLLDLYHATITNNQVAHEGLGLHFSLVIGALGEAPVRVLMPHKEQNATAAIRLAVDLDLNAFFTALERYEDSWQAILAPITPVPQSTSSSPGFNNDPLLLLPDQNAPTPVRLRTEQTPSESALRPARPGVSIFTHKDNSDSENCRPFIVRDKRALLLLPARIQTPIELYPYPKPSKRDAHHHIHFLSPTIISLITGNALHHLKALTLHDLDLKGLLTHSFAQMSRQKGTKILLIDTLTLNNDLAHHFITPQPSWWENITTTVSRWFSSRATTADSPRLTLYKTIIIVGTRKLTCFFEEKHQDGSMHGYKVQFQRPAKIAEATPDALPMSKISLKKYDRLYAKYEDFAASYRDTPAQSPYNDGHENAENTPS